MIKAEGKKGGKRLVVVFDDGKYTFNGKEDKGLEMELIALLKTEIPTFGTYCSTNADDETNIIGKLREHFFDGYADVTSDFKPEWADGEVY